MNAVEFLRSKGYPRRIIGNDGYPATLVDIQPLNDGDYAAIYRYPGGDGVEYLEEINRLVENGTFKIIEA